VIYLRHHHWLWSSYFIFGTSMCKRISALAEVFAIGRVMASHESRQIWSEGRSIKALPTYQLAHACGRNERSFVQRAERVDTIAHQRPCTLRFLVWFHRIGVGLSDFVLCNCTCPPPARLKILCNPLGVNQLRHTELPVRNVRVEVRRLHQEAVN